MIRIHKKKKKNDTHNVNIYIYWEPSYGSLYSVYLVCLNRNAYTFFYTPPANLSFLCIFSLYDPRCVFFFYTPQRTFFLFGISSLYESICVYFFLHLHPRTFCFLDISSLYKSRAVYFSLHPPSQIIFFVYLVCMNRDVYIFFYTPTPRTFFFSVYLVCINRDLYIFFSKTFPNTFFLFSISIFHESRCVYCFPTYLLRAGIVIYVKISIHTKKNVGFYLSLSACIVIYTYIYLEIIIEFSTVNISSLYE